MHASAVPQRAPLLAAPFRPAPERERRQGPAVPVGGAGASFAFANVAVHAPAAKRSAKDGGDAGGTRDDGTADAGVPAATDAGATPMDAGKPPVADSQDCLEALRPPRPRRAPREPPTRPERPSPPTTW